MAVIVSDLAVKITNNTEQAAKGIDKSTNALKKMAPETQKAASFMDLFKQRLKAAATESNGFSTNMKKLSSSIGRIAFYRAIRTGLKEVTQAFKEGTTNLYYYSQALNNLDSARAVGTMNDFATTALYVKNSLGAALMPILQSLVPVVNAIADAFVWATNAVNQFFHALKGESVFTKAKRYAVDYAEALDGASGSAKEFKKQIFGFDELNIFNSPSGGGGGSAPALDYSKMFEEAEIDGIFKKIRDRIEKNLGKDFTARFKVRWKDILFDWNNLNAEDITQKIFTGFLGLMGGVAGFLMGGVPGALIGTLTGVGLGVMFSTIDFDGDGKLEGTEVLSMVKDVASILTGAVVGWTLGGPGGALIGMSVGAGLTALIKTFAPEPGMAEMGMAFTGLLVGVMASIIKGSGVKVGLATAMGAGAGTALGLSIAGGLVLTIASLADLKTNLKDQTQFVGIAIANILNLLTGAAIGFAFGGVVGAALGITIAAGLNILINKISTDYTPQSKRELDYLNQKVDLDAMYNYLGSPQSDTKKTVKNQSILRAEGRANGGSVPSGTYFYAGEPGNPEVLGQVGARTNVTNQDQFTAGMWDVMDATNTVILQAAQALISAVQNKDFTSVVQIGDRDIVSAYDRGKTLAGTALVE